MCVQFENNHFKLHGNFITRGLSPKLSTGTFIAIENVQPLVCLVVAPVEKGWPMKEGIEVVNISEAIQKIRDLLG